MAYRRLGRSEEARQQLEIHEELVRDPEPIEKQQTP